MRRLPVLLALLLVALLAGCAGGPRKALRATVDGPLRVEGFSGGVLELENRGPAQLGFEYRDESGTLSQGELGVGARLRIDLTGVRALRLDCGSGPFSELELYVHGAGELRFLPLPKQ